LLEETDPFLRARYTFYLARNLYDNKQQERALHAFMERSRMGMSEEEVYIALYQAGQLQEQLSYPHDTVVATYLSATAVQPARAEALHAAARYCRLNKRYEYGYWFAKRGLSPRPKKGLFVVGWVYDYGMLDELAVNAYWCGRFEESKAACEQLLGDGKIPERMRRRIEDNLKFAMEKIK
jgi:hypothetical protein